MARLTRRDVLRGAAAATLLAGVPLSSRASRRLEDAGLRVAHPQGGHVLLEPDAHRVSRVGYWTRTACGASSGELNRPMGLAVGSDGRIWIANTGNDEVLVLGADGALQQRIGGYGAEPGRFRGPRDLAIAGDRVYVAEVRGHRVQVFDARGRFERVLATDLEGPVGIAGDHGRIFVASAGGERLLVLNADGRVERALPLGVAPRGVAIDDAGGVHVALRDEVVRLDAGGGVSGRWRPGGVPLALAFSDAGLSAWVRS